MSGVTAVVVLAGGEGRRMGGAKPLRPFGQTTLVAHALGLARRWSRVMALSVRAADQVAGVTGVQLIRDDRGVPGPAAGLASAFAFATEQGAARILTLPCDAPRLPDDLLAQLAAAVDKGAAVAVAASLGRLHPTCALWRISCASRLPAYLAGPASLRGFAADCGMAVVDWPAQAGDDPFANANTPAELAALQPATFAHRTAA
ncbi:molybdenum cofactor guanylyltransferase [Phenylobacterium sp.]|uniref:molybdenum cofactor guanylyltransferase n=1 Tax=Phenylobacterium sp. TaxID=1871053 RepID=UPI002EDADE4A